MVTPDYHMTMSDKTVGVAELKARLSEYLRAVRRGRTITVFDRNEPIARVIPIHSKGQLAVREPLVEYATFGRIPLPGPVTMAQDPVDVLLEERRADL
jgi:prevent-host-death family protein